MMKWLSLIWRLIGVFWGWNREQQQAAQVTRDLQEAQIKARQEEIDHETAAAKARVDDLPAAALDAELERLLK